MCCCCFALWQPSEVRRSVTFEPRRFSDRWNCCCCQARRELCESPKIIKIREADQEIRSKQCGSSGYNKKSSARIEDQLQAIKDFLQEDQEDQFIICLQQHLLEEDCILLDLLEEDQHPGKETPARTGVHGAKKATYQEPTKATISQKKAPQRHD